MTALVCPPDQLTPKPSRRGILISHIANNWPGRPSGNRTGPFGYSTLIAGILSPDRVQRHRMQILTERYHSPAGIENNTAPEPPAGRFGKGL
jgi:hypothetical protein